MPARLRPIALPVAAVAVIALAMAASAFASQTPNSATSQQASSDSATSVGSTEYDNTQFGFSLSYPADMTVSNTNEAGGAQTISFVNATTGKQFEILAIPYSQLDIAAGAYTPHDAYGTNDQGLWLRDVNVVDGDVLQVWFVKTGVMYEVITMKGDEPWLVNILKTWQFE